MYIDAHIIYIDAHYIFFKERAGARSFFAPAVSAGAQLPILIERDGGRPAGHNGALRLAVHIAHAARAARAPQIFVGLFILVQIFYNIV